MKQLLISIGLILSSANAHAYDCWAYSTRAVAQAKVNSELYCGFNGAAWHTNWQAHFDWCSGGTISVATGEDQNRVKALTSCLSRNAFIEDCNYYASRAVRQFKANKAHTCGFSGPRWHDSYAGHRDWCTKNYEETVNAEDAQRRKLLTLCIQR